MKTINLLLFVVSLAALLLSRFWIADPSLSIWGVNLFVVPTVYYCASLFSRQVTSKPLQVILSVALGSLIVSLLGTTEFMLQKTVAVIVSAALMAVIETKRK